MPNLNSCGISFPAHSPRRSKGDAGRDRRRGSGGLDSESEGADAFDEIYIRLKDKITNSGYEDDIVLERGDDYIQLRFGDSVLFYPDSAEMRPLSYPILQEIGDILKSVEDLTSSIEIGGHTATIGATTTSFFAWELSSDRAISVLKFLSRSCDLPQEIMSVAGYSKYKPVGDNRHEDGRKMNRRVEIKIIRKPGA